MSDIILEVQDVKKYYPKKKKNFLGAARYLKAVNGVSFTVRRGETFGLVGESGCGKSTLSRAILGLHDITSGKILFNGKDIREMDRAERSARMQMVFQNPYYSLNPRMTVGQIIMEPLVIHKRGSRDEREQRMKTLLELVGLSKTSNEKYPHEFSGGQRQRIGIARALALNPELIVCDEPVSALDVSIQAQVLNLLNELQKELGLTYLFISHNLSIVEYMSQRIAVMYMGQIVEISKAAALYEDPLHPYTKALLSSIPEVDIAKKRERILLLNDASVREDNPGCTFCRYCYTVLPECLETPVNLAPYEEGRMVACHWYKPFEMEVER